MILSRLKIMLALLAGLLATAAPAQTTQATTQAATAQLKLQLVTEEGHKKIQATLTDNGKTIENATVAFFARRTFGELALGKDQTLDDGTAEIDFPADLPGNAAGELLVTAKVQIPGKYANVSAQATFGGAKIIPSTSDEYPRALWAPRAPWLLVITIVGILAAVWCVYSYVVAQLWAVYRGR